MKNCKKIIFFALSFILTLAMVISSVSAEDTLTLSVSYQYNEGIYGYAPLPNGVSLFARVWYLNTSFSSDAVFVYEILQEGPASLLDELDDFADSIFPATKLDSATYYYNCHSYAWYSQSTSNTYWMPDPSPYYTDGSYYEVTSPQVGDIICYFDDKGTTSTSDDENLHSGVITEVLSGVSNGECGNSDLVMVTSKWGPGGLYNHNGYECPYTNFYPQEKEADYVKYYRAAHVHSYTHHYAQFTTTAHYAYCSCGDYVTKAHNMVEMEDDPTKIICTECNHIVEMTRSIP